MEVYATRSISNTGIINPNYVARKFVKDTRPRRVQRCAKVFQLPDNAADSLKLQAPLVFQMPSDVIQGNAFC